MGKLLSGLLLFMTFFQETWGAVTTYTCSSDNNTKVRINQIYNPQTGNETGYLELYVDNGPVDLEGWKICYGDGSRNTCVDIGAGNGDVYLDGVKIGSDADASGVPDNAFIVFNETLFATSGNPENTFAQANGEAILLDASGDAAHYLKYRNNPFNTADWKAGTECTTDYFQSSANNNGICATPDFSQPDAQWSYNCANTMGTYNADPTSPLAEWRMDECLWNGTLYEVRDSKSTHHGTSAGLNSDGRVATTVEGGVLNRAGEFRGEGYNADPYNTWYPARYYLSVPDADSLSPLSVTQGAQMGITGWFRLNNVSDTQTILHKGGNHQEYRLFIEGGKLYFTVWDIWGSPKTIGISTPLIPHGYYFFAATAKGSLLTATPLELTLYLKDGTSAYSQTGTFHLFTYNLEKDGQLYFGATNWGGGITNFLNGNLDEIKLYPQVLTPSEIDRLYLYESSGRNYDGTGRAPSGCVIIPEEPAVSFDAWDAFRSLADRNISTKIVGKPFALTLASLNETGTALQDFNGTACSRIVNAAAEPVSEWVKTVFASQSSATVTFDPARAIGGSDSAGIQIIWQKNASSALGCDALSDPGTAVASDRFAIRPASFAINAADAVAGVDFNLTFTAPPADASSGSLFYNESEGNTFDVTVAEHNSSCLLGTFSPSPEGFAFVNGSKTLETRYSEAGVLDINITDLSIPCTSRYARIDCDDANVSDGTDYTADLLPIGSAHRQIAIKPHHFNVDALLANAGNGFTYLSNDLNMSAMLTLTVTAQNEQNATTRNYNAQCYAKTTDYAVSFAIKPSVGAGNLHYFETNTSRSDINATATSFLLSSMPKELFGTDTNGSARLEVNVNFDRSMTQPLNPFDLNVSLVAVTDADGVEGNGTAADDATFVYGRVRAYDIATDLIDVANPVEIEIYGKNSAHLFLAGKPQSILYWYRNTAHDIAAVQSGTAQNSAIEVNATRAAPGNGLHNIYITNESEIAGKQKITLELPSWLSVIPANNTFYYEFLRSSYTEDKLSTPPLFEGVNSGTFEGSDFGIPYNQNTSKKGIKLFR